MHLLRDCHKIHQIWAGRQMPTLFFSEMEPTTWIKKFSSHGNGIDFLSTVWYIWKARNMQIFQQVEIHPSIVSRHALTYADDIRKSFHAKEITGVKRYQRLVSWNPPPFGSVKLNTDGSVQQSTHASAGGVIRNDLGQWIAGFSVNVGTATVFQSELWGLLYGLRLCRSLGLSNVIVELDSAALVSLITKYAASTNGLFSVLLIECLHSYNSIPGVSIHHTLREGNRVADYMANLGHSIPPGLITYDFPPVGLSILLQADELGVVFPRL